MKLLWEIADGLDTIVAINGNYRIDYDFNDKDWYAYYQHKTHEVYLGHGTLEMCLDYCNEDFGECQNGR
jgi:hypothetical protein